MYNIHRRMALTTTAKLAELPVPLQFNYSRCPAICKSVYTSTTTTTTTSVFASSLKTTQQPNKNKQNQTKNTSSHAPWMKKWTSMEKNDMGGNNSLQKGEKMGEGTKGHSAMERIVHRLRKMGLDDDDDDDDFDDDNVVEEKLGDLLKRDWIRPDTMLIEQEEKRSDLGLLPWEREEVREVGEERERERGKRKAKRAPTLAEMTMEESELKRLRGQGMVLREKVNVPKAGLTQLVLEKIHEKWRKSELVRLKFHEDLAHDMRTAHILVEVDF